MHEALSVRNLKKLYKNNRGVTEVNFTVERGDIFGLLGANGAGKTTTMKVITGLIPNHEGEVSIFGKSIRDDREGALLKMGSLIETPSFYEYMSAQQNMEIAVSYYGAQKSEIAAKLDLVKLSPYKRDKVKSFSLGMKQRMGLALAMAGNPDLYILDEPSNGLDIEGIVEIRNIILKLAAENGTSFVVSSHQSAEIQKLCNKVGVIHEGRLLETITMDEVLHQYPSLEDYYLHCIHGDKGGNMQ